ncbi:MAG: phage holin family protein [Acidiferrobacteraceae bacterium]
MARPLRTETETLVSDSREEPGILDLVKTLVAEAGALARSEADLMKLEVQESTRAMIMGAVKTAIYVGVALLGVLSLTAFLIISLGQIIDGTDPSGYWISALIIGVILTIAGGVMATWHARRISEHTDLPMTRHAITNHKNPARKGYSNLKEAVDR